MGVVRLGQDQASVVKVSCIFYLVHDIIKTRGRCKIGRTGDESFILTFAQAAFIPARLSTVVTNDASRSTRTRALISP